LEGYDGDDNRFLLRTEDGFVTESIDFSEEVKELEEFVHSILFASIETSGETLKEILDIAEGKQYVFQNEKERLDIIKEKLRDLLNSSSPETIAK